MADMLKSTGAMAGATLASRILGMVREICYARFMGDGLVAGAFVVAFMIPNLFRRLLGEGALMAAFIPVFKEQEKTAGEQAMWRTANALISGLIVALAIIVSIGLLGITAALEWGDWTAKTTLMLELLRWVFPYLFFICLAAVAMGILNARGHFFLPALGALILNVVMITAVLVMGPTIHGKEKWWSGKTADLEQTIFVLAIAVLLAGGLQFLYQLPTLWREGFRPKWISPRADDSVRAVLKRLGPGVIGVAAFQINVLATYCIGFFVGGEHVVASYGYAVRLLELPQGLFAVSMATFLLPTLSGLAAEKKFADFRGQLDDAAQHLLFVSLPAAALLFVMAEPIVQLLFQYGAFTEAATERAAWALRCLAPALPGYSLVLILGRAFYALGEVKTPVRISVFCLGLNLVLALALVFQLEENWHQCAFGVANAISSTVNAVWLWRALRRREELAGVAALGIWRQIPLILFLTTLAAAAAWALLGALAPQAESPVLRQRLLAALAPLLAAGLVYGLLGWLAGVDSARAIVEMIRRPTKKG